MPMSSARIAIEPELRGLRSLLDSLGTYIYTKDRQGRYTYVNSHVCSLFKFPPEQIIGQDDSAFFGADLLDELLHNDRQVMEEGKTLALEETNIIRDNGETRIYWTVKTPIRHNDGKIIGLSGISIDITERKQLEKDLEEQRLLLDTVLNNIDAHVYMKDEQGTMLYANRSASQLVAKSAQEVIGRSYVNLFNRETSEQFRKLDAQVFATNAPVTGEVAAHRPDGSRVYLWAKKIPIEWLDGKRVMIGFSTDITELSLLREKLRKQAQTDELTGVNNRRRFFELAKLEFRRARRYNSELATIIIDIDHFKRVNDTYGHQVGDRTLKKIAGTIQRALRASDVMARIGGEEFALFLPQTSGEEAVHFGERLREKIARTPLAIGNQRTLELTVSLGVSERAAGDEKFQQLLNRADKALYQAKTTGRNRVALLRNAAD